LKHFASPEFWVRYRALPGEIRRLADQAFRHLERDPQYPSLHLKKVGRFWSARVGAGYRVLAVEGADGLVWFWIGTHAEYDRLIG
jgi:hypothetical protein